MNERTDRTLVLPLAPSEYAVLQAQFPLTEVMWEQLMVDLIAMKPGLTATPPARAEDK